MWKRDVENQEQEQINKIENSSFNPLYQFIRTQDVPKYLNKYWKNEEKKIISRFWCGTIGLGSMFWKEKEDRIGRLCGREEESIKHWLMRCEETVTIAESRQNSSREWLRVV